MKKIFALLFISLFGIGSLQSGNSPLSWLEGSWHGVGYQNNSGTWSILFVARPDENFYQIDYPSLNCGGKWLLISGDENRAEFIEIIEKGQTLCLNGGKIIMTRVNETHISYSYFNPNSNQLEAFSTLIRIEEGY